MRAIPLSHKRRTRYTYLNLVAWADDADDVRVAAYTWYAKKYRHTFYAESTRLDRRRIYMHRLIVGLDGPDVDHRNGNGLDNRRQNLRLATRQHNAFHMRPRAQNVTSLYRGVYWSSTRQRWIAQIRVNYRAKNLGAFERKEDAALVYDDAARERFGEFVALNFPFGVEDEEC
jgi:hypothetical protein